MRRLPGAVSASETGAANSLNTLMRSIGTSVASAVAGVVLAHMAMLLGSVTLPSEDAFRTVLITGVVGFAVAAFIPRRRPADTEPAGSGPGHAPGATAHRAVAPGAASADEVPGVRA